MTEEERILIELQRNKANETPAEKSERIRLQRVLAGKLGGKAKVAKGFAVSGRAAEAGAKSKRRATNHEEEKQ